jgi:hypothetical protein
MMIDRPSDESLGYFLSPGGLSTPNKTVCGTAVLLHRPAVNGSLNGESRGQKTASLPVNYQWSHHYADGLRLTEHRKQGL